jgi:hypothetical protein
MFLPVGPRGNYTIFRDVIFILMSDWLLISSGAAKKSDSYFETYCDSLQLDTSVENKCDFPGSTVGRACFYKYFNYKQHYASLQNCQTTLVLVHNSAKHSKTSDSILVTVV